MHINKILHQVLTRLPIHHLYSLLFGMLGSMIILGVYHFSVDHLEKTKKIAVVNVTAIVNDFIKNETDHHQSQEQMTKDVKHFSMTIENIIKAISKENNVVIMPSEAIFAGSQDYTALVRLKMKSFDSNREKNES